MKDFVEGSADDGFIVFSLGSIIKGKYMPSAFQKAFVEAFGQIKQRVVWKHEGKLDGLTQNVLKSSWLPQQDLMGNYYG